MALHTVSGALVGGVGGALGAVTVATAADQLDALQFQARVALVEQGMSPEATEILTQGLAELTSIGIGSAVGGTAKRQFQNSEATILSNLGLANRSRPCGSYGIEAAAGLSDRYQRQGMEACRAVAPVCGSHRAPAKDRTSQGDQRLALPSPPGVRMAYVTQRFSAIPNGVLLAPSPDVALHVSHHFTNN